MRPMTLEEYNAYHPDNRKYELQGGRLLSQPVPGFQHGLTCSTVAFSLDCFVRPREIGFVLVGRVGFLLARTPPTLVMPDVSFVSRERGMEHPKSLEWLPGAPDLAVEVLSPDEHRADIHAKVADYLAAGCPLVWLVDPETRSVTVHRNLLFPTTLHENDVLDGADVLPGFSVPVRELFRQ